MASPNRLQLPLLSTPTAGRSSLLLSHRCDDDKDTDGDGHSLHPVPSLGHLSLTRKKQQQQQQPTSPSPQSPLVGKQALASLPHNQPQQQQSITTVSALAALMSSSSLGNRTTSTTTTSSSSLLIDPLLLPSSSSFSSSPVADSRAVPNPLTLTNKQQPSRGILRQSSMAMTPALQSSQQDRKKHLQLQLESLGAAGIDMEQHSSQGSSSRSSDDEADNLLLRKNPNAAVEMKRIKTKKKQAQNTTGKDTTGVPTKTSTSGCYNPLLSGNEHVRTNTGMPEPASSPREKDILSIRRSQPSTTQPVPASTNVKREEEVVDEDNSLEADLRQITEILESDPVRVFICTWNMGDTEPSCSLAPLLQAAAAPPIATTPASASPGQQQPTTSSTNSTVADLYVFAAQECQYQPGAKAQMTNVPFDEDDEDLGDKSSSNLVLPRTVTAEESQTCEAHWTRTIQNELNKYQRECILVTVTSMASIRLAVFCGKEHEGAVTDLIAWHEATGVAHVGANKGGLAVGLCFHGTRLLFIGAHLAAHQEYTTRRNSDYFEISSSVCDALADDGVEAFNLYHHVFFCGDLNYRVEKPYEETVALVKSGHIAPLLEADQLLNQVKQGNVFCGGFKEPKICFPPTFKCVPEPQWKPVTAQRLNAALMIDGSTSCVGNDNEGTTNKKQSCYPLFDLREYDMKKKRVPSWCDRILHKCLPHPLEQAAQCIAYKACADIRCSDHTPVYAVYELRKREVVDTKGIMPTPTGRYHFSPHRNTHSNHSGEGSLKKSVSGRSLKRSVSGGGNNATGSNTEQNFLRISNMQASNLLIADVAFGTSDPYIVFKIITFDAVQVRTTTKNATLNPNWENEIVELMLGDVSACHLQLEYLHAVLYDADAVGSDDPLGQAVMSLHEIKNTAASGGKVHFDNVPVMHHGLQHGTLSCTVSFKQPTLLRALLDQQQSSLQRHASSILPRARAKSTTKRRWRPRAASSAKNEYHYSLFEIPFPHICRDSFWCFPCQISRQCEAVSGRSHSLSCLWATLSAIFFCGTPFSACYLRRAVERKYNFVKQSCLMQCCIALWCPCCSLMQTNEELLFRNVDPGTNCLPEVDEQSSALQSHESLVW